MIVSLVIYAFTAISNHDKTYVKRVDFPKGASLAEKVKMAAHVVPTQQQLDWQKMEMTAFIHFTINTFTGMEWGDGLESPQLFNPTALDARQWAKTVSDAGMKMIILTAKHHDGFCLWPTATTSHSVASSPWKNGEGDVVKALKEACDEYDLKFGVYLSPWDRNAECYGDSPAYNAFFVEQLTELLSWYGPVDEVWFDGACGEGPNGKKQVYDWDMYYATIQALQPDAVIAVMGEDVRWVGTETGYGRATEWSATVLAPGGTTAMNAINEKLDLKPKSKDLGSRAMLEKTDHLFWYPAEVDVSIRPGWFYHEREDEEVKSLEKMVDIYFNSVGMNAVLLLNIPPDTRGLIHENDVKRLQELRTYLDVAFKDNLMDGVMANRELLPTTDGDYDTYRTIQYLPDTALYEFTQAQDFNVLMLQEYIAKGQRVEAFEVEVLVQGQWQKIASGTTIGYKRLLRFPNVIASQLRVIITAARDGANINTVALYKVPILSAQMQSRKNMAEDKSKWKVVGFSDQTEQFKAANAIDGDVNTLWHTHWGEHVPSHPHFITVDMGEPTTISGMRYSPRTTENLTGTISRFSFYVSNDGEAWTCVIDNGEFSNIKNNPIPQTVLFDTVYTARYFKFESGEEIDGNPWLSAGEIGILRP